MSPRASPDIGGSMIWTTRTIGLLVTMAMLTGGAAWGVHALLMMPDGAGLDHGLDTNGNGKFEWLVVEAQVSLPQAGTWDLSADLSASKAPPTGSCSGRVPIMPPVMQLVREAAGPIAWIYERYFFEEGPQTVRMAFAGTDIERSEVDGPYLVHARLSLGGLPYMGAIRAPEPIPTSSMVEWNYTTHSYSADQFEPPLRPAFFTGPHADSAVDVDSDGLADFLVLTAEVHVNTAGHYNLWGSLTKGSGTDVVRLLAYTSRDFNLSTDDTSVFLRFRGDQIRQAAVDGPWDFTLTLFGPFEMPPYVEIGQPADRLVGPMPEGYAETLCGSTGAYRYLDFDDTVELLRYTGRFEESTPDRDADGKYDALIIRAEVDVYVGAGFDATGILRPTNGTSDVARSAVQAWLPDGVQWVDFVFPGSEIHAGGIDGPYEATLSLTPSPIKIDPATTYVTKAYRAADFEVDTVGTRGYWFGNLTAVPAGTGLSINAEVVRGPDMLAVVFEDMLTLTVSDSTGSVIRSFQTKVVLANSGSTQTFSFSADGLAAGRYAVTAVLGPAERPVETRTVVVTL